MIYHLYEVLFLVDSNNFIYNVIYRSPIMLLDLTLAICVYNAERYIEETLESVMAQTVQDFHLLIVNDCSTDGSVALK